MLYVSRLRPETSIASPRFPLLLLALMSLSFVSCSALPRKTEAETFCDKGLAKYEERDYDAAVVDYTRAISLDSSCWEAFYGRGRAKTAKGNYDGAIADYDMAIMLLKGTGSTRELAEVYHNRGFVKAKMRNDDDAIADYCEAVRLNPEYATVYAKTYRSVAEAKEEQGDFEGAVNAYGTIIALLQVAVDKQGLAEAYCTRGYLKERMGDYRRAIADYDEAIRLYPNCVQALINRGAAKTEQGNLNSALIDLDKAIVLLNGTDDNEKSAMAYCNRGNVKVRKKEYDEAIANYDKAVHLDPNLARAFLNRGVAKKSIGNFDSAAHDYDTAIAMLEKGDEKHILAMAYKNRGILDTKQGNFDKALAYYDKAITAYQDTKDKNGLAGAYDCRAFTRFCKRDYSGAISDCTEAIRLCPKRESALSGRALAKAMMAAYDDAIKDLKRLLELNPNLAGAWQMLAFAYSKKRDKKNCLAALREAVKLDRKCRSHVLQKGQGFDWLHDDPDFKRLVEE